MDAQQANRTELPQLAQVQLQNISQTISKQPNKLKDLFNNNDADSITEVDVINYQPHTNSKLRQANNLIEVRGEALNQIQKRPSTHKNMQSSIKIFEMDKNNSGNAIRKTEELIASQNPENIETNINVNQSEQNLQRGQGSIPMFQ